MRYRTQSFFNHNYFDVIDTEPKAYWLGFLMADGCVKDRVRTGSMQLSVHLSCKDESHLMMFRSAIEADAKNIHRHAKSVRLVLSSDVLCESLIRHGCVPRKSLILRFPQIVSNLERHFVRGYFDGDGSASIHKHTLFITFVGTEDFLTGVKRVMGITRKLIKHGNIYSLMVNGREVACRVGQLMYEGASIYLPRKKEVFDSGMNRTPLAATCGQCGIGFNIQIGQGLVNRRYCGIRCRQKADRVRRKISLIQQE